MKIDAHQHFWQYNVVKQAWIDDTMRVIRNDFFPEQLAPILIANQIDGCVAVQADQTEQETDFLIEQANKNPFIKAVVGWVDLKAPNLVERLAYYQQYPIVKGFRHILQGEDPSFMLSPEFTRGISALADFGYTYDILIYPKHLSAALELVIQFPNQPFVIDHLAKPFIKEGTIADWKIGMNALAQHSNVFCKLSGMVTEADWLHWNEADFTPYLDAVVASFGIERIMFGSDWPVCLVAASYEKMAAIVTNYFSQFSAAEQELVFGKNAIKFYHL
jgi:L-fuconolactonase